MIEKQSAEPVNTDGFDSLSTAILFISLVSLGMSPDYLLLKTGFENQFRQTAEGIILVRCTAYSHFSRLDEELGHDTFLERIRIAYLQTELFQNSEFIEQPKRGILGPRF